MSGCNPTNTTGCPPDAALGTTWDLNFLIKFIGDETYFYQWPEVDWDARGLVMTVSNATDKPFILFPKYIFFGKADITLQPLPGVGIATVISLFSDDLDMINWAILGAQDGYAQCDYARMGVPQDQSFFTPVVNVTTAVHTFSVEWTREVITYSVDGTMVRNVTWAGAENGKFYPQTPLQLRIFSFAAGNPNASTENIACAGGSADFNKGPFVGYLQRVRLQDYMNGNSAANQYNYTDQSGSYEAISIYTYPWTTPSSTTASFIPTPSATTTASAKSSLATLQPPAQLNTGAIAGGVIGSVVLLLMVGLGLVLYLRKRKRGKEPS